MHDHYFSCVVDNKAIYKLQALNWLWTLLASGTADRDEIIIHIIKGGDLAFSQILDYLGITFHMVDRFGEGEAAFCNKLVQLGTPELRQANCVVLCDTDIAFSKDIRPWLNTNAIRAKIADYPNPPLDVIRRLYAATGITARPRNARTDFSRHSTFEMNCNGGVYIIPTQWISVLSQSWVRWARFILERRDTPLVYRKHADQVGFCFAMLELGLPFEKLPLSLNFPTHFSPSEYSAVSHMNPLVYHYHRRMNQNGDLLPLGIPRFDTAIDQINEVIRTQRARLISSLPTATETFMQWQNNSIPEEPEVNTHFGLRHLLNKVIARMNSYRGAIRKSTRSEGIDRSQLTDLQATLVDFSSSKLGFFTQTPGRLHEYPWAINEAGDVYGKKMLDVGAGINPLPLWFASRGAHVVTADNHPIIRTGPGSPHWDEWGYLDYSSMDANVASLHCDIVDSGLDNNSFDIVYSISVLEHIRRSSRQLLIHKMASLLKADGILLLTLDLIRGTDNLWNMSEGKVVEKVDSHGDVESIITELTTENLLIRKQKKLTDISGGRTDIVLIKAVKSPFSA
ncbi:MAG: class I SAM-dependent methyltransferase [Chloroflexi bacterium]|nr:class I SAM-dependent methyltransferase [Chloroflexota bacterium]